MPFAAAPSSPYVVPGPNVMIPAQFSYAAWMMKSAESSAGCAPLTLVMQSGALSMMPGMALLSEIPPALLAHGPLQGPADDGEHDEDGRQEGQHQFCTGSWISAWPFCRSNCVTVAVSASVPSGCTICSLITPISG